MDAVPEHAVHVQQASSGVAAAMTQQQALDGVIERATAVKQAAPQLRAARDQEAIQAALHPARELCQFLADHPFDLAGMSAKDLTRLETSLNGIEFSGWLDRDMRSGATACKAAIDGEFSKRYLARSNDPEAFASLVKEIAETGNLQEREILSQIVSRMGMHNVSRLFVKMQYSPQALGHLTNGQDPIAKMMKDVFAHMHVDTFDYLLEELQAEGKPFFGRLMDASLHQSLTNELMTPIVESAAQQAPTRASEHIDTLRRIDKAVRFYSPRPDQLPELKHAMHRSFTVGVNKIHQGQLELLVTGTALEKGKQVKRDNELHAAAHPSKKQQGQQVQNDLLKQQEQRIQENLLLLESAVRMGAAKAGSKHEAKN